MNKNIRRSFFAAPGLAGGSTVRVAVAKPRGVAAALVIQGARAARAHRAAEAGEAAAGPRYRPSR
ncbi:hypothetical protein [Streptomyces phaeofaciens]|uniref:hypothetical protein n=1 Tax=Streptomyces phaeofaciens TaxID=68254 RepID=UPI00369EADDE